MDVNPEDLLFTQDSIKNTFQKPHENERIDDAVDALLLGNLKSEDFPRLRVVSHAGRLWSVDNRRLWVFRKANVPVINVQLVAFHPRLDSRLGLMKRFRSPRYWPRVRGDCRELFYPVVPVEPKPSTPFPKVHPTPKYDLIGNADTHLYAPPDAFLVRSERRKRHPEQCRSKYHLVIEFDGVPKQSSQEVQENHLYHPAAEKKELHVGLSAEVSVKPATVVDVSEVTFVDQSGEAEELADVSDTREYYPGRDAEERFHCQISQEMSVNAPTVLDVPSGILDVQEREKKDLTGFPDDGERSVYTVSLPDVRETCEQSSHPHAPLHLDSLLTPVPEAFPFPKYVRIHNDDIHLRIIPDVGGNEKPRGGSPQDICMDTNASEDFNNRLILLETYESDFSCRTVNSETIYSEWKTVITKLVRKGVIMMNLLNLLYALQGG